MFAVCKSVSVPIVIKAATKISKTKYGLKKKKIYWVSTN